MPSILSATDPVRRGACVSLCFAVHGLLVLPASAREPVAPPQEHTTRPPNEAEAAANYERARVLAREGLEAFRLKDFATAISKFEESYRLSHAPLLLYDLAQAHRLAGNCAEARRYYDEFLATEPHGEVRARAESQLQKMEPCASAGPAKSGAPAANAVEPSRSVPSPLPQRSAATARRPVLARTAQRASVPVRAPDANPEDRARTAHAIVGFGSSALLLGSSAYFGWRAQQASSEVSNAYRDGAAWSSQLAATQESGSQSERLAVASLVTGLLATGVSIWLVSFD